MYSKLNFFQYINVNLLVPISSFYILCITFKYRINYTEFSQPYQRCCSFDRAASRLELFGLINNLM